MKLVIVTQFKENYGAHDWDGKGECPQYWKFKGGDTYIIDVNLSEAQSPAFYDSVAKCIEHSSNYSMEYIISETIVDDIDFKESDFVSDWDTAIYAIKLSDRDMLACRRLQKSYDLTNTVVGERSWLQTESGKEEMSYITFEEAA